MKNKSFQNFLKTLDKETLNKLKSQVFNQISNKTEITREDYNNISTIALHISLALIEQYHSYIQDNSHHQN